MRNLSKLMRLFNIALMNTLYNISNKVTQSTHITVTCVSVRVYILQKHLK